MINDEKDQTLLEYVSTIDRVQPRLVGATGKNLDGHSNGGTEPQKIYEKLINVWFGLSEL